MGRDQLQPVEVRLRPKWGKSRTWKLSFREESELDRSRVVYSQCNSQKHTCISIIYKAKNKLWTEAMLKAEGGREREASGPNKGVLSRGRGIARIATLNAALSGCD